MGQLGHTPHASSLSPLAKATRIIVKIGSRLLVHPESGELHASWLESLADDIASSISGVIEIPWDVSKIESGIYIAKILVSNKGKSESKIVKVGVIK